MSSNPDFLQYLWVLISAPIGFVSQRYISLSSRTTKNETEINNLKENDSAICEQLNSIDKKIDSMARDLNQLIGRFNEHRD